MVEGRTGKVKIRFILAVVILAASISLLVWAYTPNPRESRVQRISPAEMQLP
jgi:hypothetical protein